MSLESTTKPAHLVMGAHAHAHAHIHLLHILQYQSLRCATGNQFVPGTPDLLHTQTNRTSTAGPGSMLQNKLHAQHRVNTGVKAATAVQRPQRPCSRVRSQSEAAEAAEPTVTLKFVTTEAPNEPIVVECPSGEQLRACMLENKVDLYTTWGKIWSCGGAGQCGTCIVQVVEDGADLLSERTATEDKKLNKKPESWRLACQTIVGDGTNSGTVVIQTKPQGK